MEEDLTIPHDSTKNCSISAIEEEKEKMKDYMYRHFRDVTDGAHLNNAEESSIKEHESSPKKDKHPLFKGHCKVQQGAVFSGKILSFGCSMCKDDFTYSPNDLLKHFRAAHKGNLPTYPCDLCGFVTNEFSTLQRHRIEHKNTLVTCEVCNDDVQYSLLLLTRHYIMCHSQNGQFKCDWCEFTTVDAGTFVQHIHHHNETHWKCAKCKHISLNQDDHQRHMKAHSGTFPFTCEICGYGAARNEFLKKHSSMVHKQETEKNKLWTTAEDSSTTATAGATLKMLLKKNTESQEVQRKSKLNSLSGNIANQNGRVISSELSLEEMQHIVEGTLAKKDNNWSRGPHNTELSASALSPEMDNSVCSDHTNPNGVTVLRVKNKISLPPNCTTKVMGFKVVDGKKHLVLKVIQSMKQDSTIQNNSTVEDLGSLSDSPSLDKSRDSAENGESSLSRSPVSPRTESCIHVDQDDIMAVKVKIEEEETSVSHLDSTPHRDADGQSPTSQNTSYDDINDRAHPNQSCLEKKSFDGYLIPETVHSDAGDCSGSQISNSSICPSGDSGLSFSSKFDYENTTSKLASKESTVNLGVTSTVLLAESGAHTLVDENKRKSTFQTVERDGLSCPASLEKTNGVGPEMTLNNGPQNFKKLSSNSLLPSELSPLAAGSQEGASGSDKLSQNSPNQEVFTFHNYSKETFCTSPYTPQSVDNMSEIPSDRESICESSQFSLTLPASPEQLTGKDQNVAGQETDKSAFASESEADDCAGSVYDPTTEDENLESVLQDFNIIKVEEDSIPISNVQAESNNSSTSCASFVEEHSDEIITQQLNREKAKRLSASNDILKQTKTTLRFLQLPDGNKPILLRTTENCFAMPVPVKATPGFKLITNSTNPQINVSYMKPKSERVSNPTALPSSPKDRTVAAVSTPKVGPAEKETPPAVQPRVAVSSNHYVINRPCFKGPLLLSSAQQNTPPDKAVKAQPTCYFVQRSAPMANAPNAPGLRLGSSQDPLVSRPVLAMPRSPSDKPSTLQPGRQAFLLRYISPTKSGLLLNNQDTNTGSQCSQASESTGNKVIFKIVTPTGSLLTSGATTSSGQPLFLATRPQTQCFLLPSNKTNANASNGVNKLITFQNATQKDVQGSCISPSRMNVMVHPCEAEKPVLAPRPIRPPSQRKRRMKPLFDELPSPMYKARRLSNRTLTEKETTVLWKPVAKEVERTLRLAPYSSLQQIKCPRRYQPVVVLNHPDADIPEVANIMKVVNRYNGAVTRVSLSQKTIQALSELGAQGNTNSTKGASSHGENPRPRPVQSSVRERFLLKLKLRKKSRKKYEVVDSLAGSGQESVVFDCWFCGRLFNSQEDWIGHGQRHLMEATRDWNKLF